MWDCTVGHLREGDEHGAFDPAEGELVLFQGCGFWVEVVCRGFEFLDLGLGFTVRAFGFWVGAWGFGFGFGFHFFFWFGVVGCGLWVVGCVVWGLGLRGLNFGLRV